MTIINGHTSVFGILGEPVRHVRTPQALNALFDERNYNGVLVPIEVSPGDGLAKAVASLKASRNWGGFLVTVPHKTAVAEYCDRLSSRAKVAGAVNVVRREADGSLTGDHLDGVGFVGGLRLSRIDPAGCKAFLAGAGGAASAIAFALAEAGVTQLTIVNRSIEKATQIATRIALDFPQVVIATQGQLAGHNLVINGTSLGLSESDPLPIDATELEAGMLVAEVVMSPEITPLLREAAARGCQIHPGVRMLEGQLQAIFSFLTARDAIL
ncbi:shikimate dehydrogenase [Bradyrhizobium sp. AZCC 2262]|uniref:shikimate dehydrogenase family protein n=1 Tax=Bradyrhizobium sp. AZCC 2262 TaxID=3117022 RepID=UPI002FF0EAEF